MTLLRQHVLKPYTIIPSELYVERAADRQLTRILNEMGRPGYVLVARQMGKTNLLLNAKRNMAGGPDAFVYVDVSNIVPDLRTFFRFVVDTCLESYADKLAGAVHAISERRSSSRQLLEHKEHELELRDLLNAFTGRLIICLDEIDALTKTDYSDQVFSLIRSIYFSGRTNFPEFTRLTYVLSGVAEPTEIIKNRAISPFNIGEKIYLDDFSVEEFRTFLEKSQLKLNDSVVNTIYAWAGGNPRLSWDLCAAVENHDGPIDDETVNQLVERLYLRTFDLPPIDHIRTLVETDKDVRSAIMAMHYKKSESVSDAVKSRLYLAGIISLSSASSEIRIKNRITEAALSEKWIAEIEREEQSPRDYADSLYNELRYLDALAAYENCETEESIGDMDSFTLRKGNCHYFIGDYAGAIQTFTAHPIPKSRSVDYHVVSQSRIANSQLMLGKLLESITIYEKLVKEFSNPDGDFPISVYEAKLNLSTAYLRLSTPNFDRAVELCESVISTISKATPDSDLTPESTDRCLCIAHYNLHVVQLRKNERDAAKRSLDEAIPHAGRSDRATLLLERAREFDRDNTRIDSIVSCAEYCLSNDVPITSNPRTERALSFSLDRAAALLFELELGQAKSAKTLQRFLHFCHDPRIGHEVDPYQIILRAANFAFALGKSASAIRIYSSGARLEGPSPSDDYWTVLSFHLAVCPSDEVFESSAPYIKRLLDTGERPAGLAVRASHRVIQTLLNRGDTARADEILSAIGVKDFVQPVEASTFDELFDQFLRLITDAALSPENDFRTKAQSIFDAISKYSGPPSELYPEDYKQYLLGQLMAVFPNAFTTKQVLRTEPKKGRNEIVKVRLISGKDLEGKFKKLEPLVREGKATWITR